jgi:hypothetical protein
MGRNEYKEYREYFSMGGELDFPPVLTHNGSYVVEVCKEHHLALGY